MSRAPVLPVRGRPIPGRRRAVVSRALAALLVAMTVVLTGVAGAPGPAAADPLSDQRQAAQQRQRQAAQQRAALQDALEGVSVDLAQTTLDLQAVQAQLPAAQDALAAAQAALERSQREQAQIAARLQDAQDQQATVVQQISDDTAKAERLRGSIGQLAREAYMGGDGPSTLGVLLGAQSTEDFVQSSQMVSTALRTQQQVLAELRSAEATDRNNQARLAAVQDIITQLKAEADAQVAAADTARQQAADAQAKIQQVIADTQVKQAAFEASKAAILDQLAAADAEAARITAELADIARQEQARANQKPSGAVNGALFANPTSFTPWVVNSDYGMRFHPILHIWRLHAGTDLRAYCGTEIYAARAGTVVWAQYRDGLGNSVGINHGLVSGNSLASSYNHLTRSIVSVGEHVGQGQLIGYAGNTGTSAGCHLHFEVYVNGATVNPRPLLAG